MPKRKAESEHATSGSKKDGKNRCKRDSKSKQGKSLVKKKLNFDQIDQNNNATKVRKEKPEEISARKVNTRSNSDLNGKTKSPFSNGKTDCTFCEDESVPQTKVKTKPTKKDAKQEANVDMCIVDVEELDYEDVPQEEIGDDVLVTVDTDEFMEEETSANVVEEGDVRRVEQQRVDLTNATVEELMLKQNPHLESYVNKLFNARIQKVLTDNGVNKTNGNEVIVDKQLSNSKRDGNRIKSPSDTTIYAPGLARECYPVEQLVGAPLPLHDRTAKGMTSKDVNNIVSNFVESVRLEQTTHN